MWEHRVHLLAFLARILYLLRNRTRNEFNKMYRQTTEPCTAVSTQFETKKLSLSFEPDPNVANTY